MNDVIITTTGMISNTDPTSKPNPHECHHFIANIDYTVVGVIKEHKEWWLSGEYPKGLSIEGIENPILTGDIKPFSMQELEPDLYYPEEPLKADGSNRLNNGGFRDATYTFEFKIHHSYDIEEINPDPLLPPLIINKEAESTVSILVIRSGNIANTLFLKNYLDVEDLEEVNDLVVNNGQATLEIKMTRRMIPYDGVHYYKENLEELYQVHPGPFSKCKGE